MAELVPGAGTPIYKDRACRKFWKESRYKRYQGPVLWEWLEFFSSLSGISPKTTHYLLLYFFFQLNTIAKVLTAQDCWDLLGLNTLRSNKTAF